MIKPETIARVDEIIAKLNEDDGMFIQGMVNEIERLQRKIKRDEEQRIEDSWRRNPDRMGGQFSDQEILDSYRNRW